MTEKYIYRRSLSLSLSLVGTKESKRSRRGARCFYSVCFSISPDKPGTIFLFLFFSLNSQKGHKLFIRDNLNVYLRSWIPSTPNFYLFSRKRENPPLSKRSVCSSKRVRNTLFCDGYIVYTWPISNLVEHSTTLLTI